MDQVPDSLTQERDELIAVIHEVFLGVTRDGGVSWSETYILDSAGSKSDQAKARELDTEKSWQELVNDPRWQPGLLVGGWSFLDPVGFRYYLPAGMIRAANLSCSIFFPSILNASFIEDREWALNLWSKLDVPQRRAIAHFITFMKKLESELDHASEATKWEQAYESYWFEFG